MREPHPATGADWRPDGSGGMLRGAAAAYFDLLRDAGFPTLTRPDPEPTSPPPTRTAQLWWMLTKGSRWLAARSTDLVPYLAKLAWTEWRTGTGPISVPPACQLRQVGVALREPAGPVG